MSVDVAVSEESPRTGWMQENVGTVFAGFLVWVALLPGQCRVAAEDVPPLFDVCIDHEFPKSREAFEQVLGLVQKHYYADELDEKSLWWAAVEGVLRRISPEENPGLAAIWLPEDFENVDNALHGVQESIGIKSSFNPRDGALTVTEVITGGPSEHLLEPYDRIVRIDALPLKGLSVKEIDRMLKGEAGTRVSVKVVRDVQVFDLLITRERVNVRNVESGAVTDSVGYVSIRRFSEGVSEELVRAVTELMDGGSTGLLLDLRGNGGGVFSEALKSAEAFIPKGGSLMRMVTHGDKVNNYVSSNEEPIAIQMVVLVDEASASASEIVAAALRDEVDASIVGEKTYGKATMEKIFTLENEYRVKFTTAALFSPKGKSWQPKGLIPDFPIGQDAAVLKQTRKLSLPERLARDPQLLAACRLLNSQTGHLSEAGKDEGEQRE